MLKQLLSSVAIGALIVAPINLEKLSLKPTSAKAAIARKDPNFPPCQWNYTFTNGVATATYCGVVTWTGAALTPQSQGAVCDGVTDDSAALNQWLSKLGTFGVSASPVYAGYIPGGTCAFKNHLAAPTINAISIFGDGVNSQLRYTGTDTTVTGISFGTTNNGCSSSGVTLRNFLISTATVMTAGAAMEFDDVCALRMENVAVEGNAGGATSTWANGVIEKGGNQHYMNNNTITAITNGVLIYGDASTQLSDPRWNGGIVSGAIVGINIAGNVGGATFDNIDVLSNQTELKISRDSVNVANLQIFLGPSMAIDVTQGGLGRGIDLEDVGSNNSILTISGTWIAGSGSDCFYVAASVANWVIHWNGGNLINCTTNGVNDLTTNETNMIWDINDVVVNMTLAGFTGQSGYAFAAATTNFNRKLRNIPFQSAAGSRFTNANWTPSTSTNPNTLAEQLGNGAQFLSYTVAGLPACNAANKGLILVVSDFTGTPTYNAGVTGGGAISLPVYCNGSAWTQH